MAATVNKSIYPPPPPFYQLYTQPPPMPSEKASESFHQLPIDLYEPPPPLNEPFLKFGELQLDGYESHQLPPDVTPLYVLRQDAPLTASASPTASSTTTTPPSSYPDLVDYSLSLRLLNRQYLACYLQLLSSLVPPPGSPEAASSPDANPAQFIEQHLKELSEISANFALLLTRLRPHQANQTLLQVMMKQIERRKKKKEQILNCIAEAKSFLSSHGVQYAEGSTSIEPLNQTQILTALQTTPASPSTTATRSSMPHVKQESKEMDEMEVDDQITRTNPIQSGAGGHPSAAVPDPIAQLKAYLDTIPSDA